MSIRAGRLRSRIEIVKLTESTDKYGAVTPQKESVGTFWCELNQLSSTQQDGTLIQNQSVVEFTTRYNQQLGNITPDMFIVFKGEEYNIDSVINPRLLNEYLVITSTKRG